MKIAIISLSAAGGRIAARLAEDWPGCDVFLHSAVGEADKRQSAAEAPCPPFAASHPPPRRFARIVDLTREIFAAYDALLYVAPTGVVVRAIAPLVAHKTVDPAVVVIDVGGRWAISLLGGHERGGNALALAAANCLGAEPIISTATEAAKDLIVGLGCRRGTSADAITAAIREALTLAGCDLARVRLLATAAVKADEPGLLEAARRLDVPLRIIDCDEIRATIYAFEPSRPAQDHVDLPAVAEPAALLAGRRTQLLLPKQARHGVTVAIARENCTWLASDPAGASTAPTGPSRPSPKAE
ncbi:MAG: cobalamin biosynthesis protein [Thermoguttaceae bacterium]